MENLTFSLANSKTGKAYVRVSETGFDEIGLAQNKAGFVEVHPDKQQAVLEMFQNGELQAIVGGLNSLGQYIITVSKVTIGETELA